MQFSTTKTINGSFPSEQDLPGYKATAAWLLQYAKAAYAECIRRPRGSIGFSSGYLYNDNDAYVDGTQDVSKYKAKLSFRSGEREAGEYRRTIDYRVIPLYPKLVRQGVGMVRAAGFDVQVDPIDASAQKELSDQFSEAKAKIVLRDQAGKMGMKEVAEMPELTSNPGEPEDYEGLEISAMGARHVAAIEAELVREYVLTTNNWTDIEEKVITDAFSNGIGICYDAIEGERIVVRHVKPRDLLMSHCRNTDLSDLRYIGRVDYVHPANLMEISGGTISEDMLPGIYSGANSGMTYEKWFVEHRVAVVNLDIYTNDTLYREERTRRNGNLVHKPTIERNKNVQNGSIRSKKIIGHYVCKWVVGTDHVFDYGPAPVAKRPKNDMARVLGSYHMMLLNFNDMNVFSRTDSNKTLIDAMMIAWYKLQHALNMAIPRGYAIDIGALEDIDLDDVEDVDAMTPRDALEMFFSQGILVYRSKDAKNQQVAPPIKEITTGVGTELDQFWKLFQNCVEMMRMTLGVNELTDGSTPNAKMLTQIAQMAAVGTNNAMSDLLTAHQRMMRSLVESIIVRTQVMAQAGMTGLLTSALGSDTTRLMTAAPSMDRFTMGFKITPRPTIKEKEDLEAAMNEAQAKGEITISDRLFLNSIDNQKQRALHLDYRIRRNQQQAAALAEQNSKMQAQVAENAAQAATQRKREELSHEYELKSEYAKTVKGMDQQIMKMRIDGDLEIRRIEASGRVEAAYSQAAQRDTANIRDNATDLIKDGQPEAAAEIGSDPLLEEGVLGARAERNGAAPDPFSVDVPAGLNSRVAPQTAGGVPLKFTPPPPLRSSDMNYDDLSADQELSEELDPMAGSMDPDDELGQMAPADPSAGLIAEADFVDPDSEDLGDPTEPGDGSINLNERPERLYR